MQFFTSFPTETTATAVLLVLMSATFIFFFYSFTIAFRGFILLALTLSMILIIYWIDTYKTAQQREKLVRPIVEEFSSGIVEDGLSITKLTWNGKTLSHTYAVATQTLIPDRTAARLQTCSGSIRVGLLALGGTIEHNFEIGGQSMVEYSFAVRDCFENE